jgi:hypothetical protein
MLLSLSTSRAVGSEIPSVRFSSVLDSPQHTPGACGHDDRELQHRHRLSLTTSETESLLCAPRPQVLTLPRLSAWWRCELRVKRNLDRSRDALQMLEVVGAWKYISIVAQ